MSAKYKILITGVAGFIGSNLALRFINEGYSVVGVDDLSSGSIDNIPKEVDFIYGDLSKNSTISKLPIDCSKILHLAGQSSGEISFDDPVADLNKNTVSTLNLIHFGIESKVERIVYASSMSIYGDVPDMPISEEYYPRPLSCYGVGKCASESYLRIYRESLSSVILRMFNVYGPGQDLSNLRQGMISIYLAQALESGIIEVKGGVDRFRDFIYIDDVVEAWYRAATHSSVVGKTFNLGTGIRTTVKSALDHIVNLVPETKVILLDSTPGDQSGIYANSEAIKTSLGITSFTAFNHGLEKFAKWAKVNGKK